MRKFSLLPLVETITVTTKFVVTAVTTKLVVTAVMTKLILTAVTTKLVVPSSYYDEAGRIGILLRILRPRWVGGWINCKANLSLHLS